MCKQKERKAFSFYKSYWDSYKELPTAKEKAEFIEIINAVQFLEVHVDAVQPQNQMVKLLFSSIKHSLEASVRGYCSKLKIDYDSYPWQGGSVGGRQGGSVPPSVQEEEKEEEKEKVKEQDKIYSAFENEFEYLWNKYPKKRGKKGAYKHFKANAKNEETIRQMDEALDNYLEEIRNKKTDMQYIKHGDTWFNNWEDYKERTKHERKIAGISEDFLKEYLNS